MKCVVTLQCIVVYDAEIQAELLMNTKDAVS